MLPKNLPAAGVKSSFGITLARPSMMFHRLARLSPLSFTSSYVAPPAAIAAASASAAVSASVSAVAPAPGETFSRSQIAEDDVPADYVISSSTSFLIPVQLAAMSKSVASANAVMPIVRMPVSSAGTRTSSVGAMRPG